MAIPQEVCNFVLAFMQQVMAALGEEEQPVFATLQLSVLIRGIWCQYALGDGSITKVRPGCASCGNQRTKCASHLFLDDGPYIELEQHAGIETWRWIAFLFDRGVRTDPIVHEGPIPVC